MKTRVGRKVLGIRRGDFGSCEVSLVMKSELWNLIKV